MNLNPLSTAVLSVTIFFGVSIEAQAAIAEGIYQIKVKQSDLCLDVSGGSTEQGARIIQWHCHDGNNQRWQITHAGNGYYQLTAMHSGMAMDVTSASTDNGAVIQQWVDNDTLAQRFAIEEIGNNEYRLLNRNSWKSLDIKDFSTDPGASLQQWDWYGTDNQTFILIKDGADDKVPGWSLVWRDEFDGGSIDTGKWAHEVNGAGGGNNELQYYTARPQNSWVSGGSLHIQALKEQYTGPDGTRSYTSARLRTANKGDWLYGRIDVRAKLPWGQGLWPAIWMLPTDWVYGGWAASGEIDIMEAVNLRGSGGNRIHGTLHYGGPWPANTHSGSSTTPATSVVDNFHTYTVEWEEQEIRWYIDGVHYQTQNNWYSTAAPYPAPYNQRFHLILNVAVGGNWPGNPDGSTVFPQVMEVDYVRVYRRNP